MKYRVEIQYDRGKQYVTVAAADEFEALRLATAGHPSAFGARVLPAPSYEEYERQTRANQGYGMRTVYHDPLEVE
jgi:hypothetical protein